MTNKRLTDHIRIQTLLDITGITLIASLIKSSMVTSSVVNKVYQNYVLKGWLLVKEAEEANEKGGMIT